MKNKSFTLIELLVVIVIIGILAGVIIVSVSSSINKANFAKAQSFSNTVQNELLGDLVSEWTFNSPAVSGKTEDSWGNNDGTLVGANGLPQLQTKENCVYGTCYEFDGIDDYIDCGNDDSLKITKEITLSAWIKRDESGVYDGIVFKSNSYLLSIDNFNKVYFNYNNGTGWVGGSFSDTLITDSIWHYIMASYKKDRGTVQVFVDGEMDKETSVTADFIVANSKTLSIGHCLEWSDAWFFNGLIDDVRIYNTALSSAQIKQQYVAGLDSLLSKNLISQEEYNQNIKNLALR